MCSIQTISFALSHAVGQTSFVANLKTDVSSKQQFTFSLTFVGTQHMCASARPCEHFLWWGIKRHQRYQYGHVLVSNSFHWCQGFYRGQAYIKICHHRICDDAQHHTTLLVRPDSDYEARERKKSQFWWFEQYIWDMAIETEPFQHLYHIHSVEYKIISGLFFPDWHALYVCFEQEYVVCKPRFDCPCKELSDRGWRFVIDILAVVSVVATYDTDMNPALWLTEINRKHDKDKPRTDLEELEPV